MIATLRDDIRVAIMQTEACLSIVENSLRDLEAHHDPAVNAKGPVLDLLFAKLTGIHAELREVDMQIWKHAR